MAAVITRTNVNFIKRVFSDRLGNDYVYGGQWDPFNLDTGIDCSGLVTAILSGTLHGTAMDWSREGLSTESYRYRPLGPQQVGPFSLVHVGSYTQFPAGAAVLINLHHEGAGGPDSHMNCVCDGTYMESSGSYGCCTLGQPGAPVYGGAIAMSNPYWNDWWYLPGPISGDAATVLDYSAPPVPGLVAAQFL